MQARSIFSILLLQRTFRDMMCSVVYKHKLLTQTCCLRVSCFNSGVKNRITFLFIILSIDFHVSVKIHNISIAFKTHSKDKISPQFLNNFYFIDFLTFPVQFIYQSPVQNGFVQRFKNRKEIHCEATCILQSQTEPEGDRKLVYPSFFTV